MKKRFVHSGVSDDLDLLLAAMEPAPGKRFLTVSAHGAGEAALALAAGGAEEVAALDIEDPASLTRLLEVKTTAAQLFGREDYLVIMGLRPASILRRRALARQLILGMAPEQAEYWRERKTWLEEGLFHADQIAISFRWMKTAIGALAPKKACDLIFGGSDGQERARAFERHVDRRWLRRVLQQIGRFNLFFPDKEWRASEYPRRLSRDPIGYLAALVEAGFADNPLFAHLVQSDKVLPEALLPPHLRPASFDGLRARVTRARSVIPPIGASRLGVPLIAEAYDGAYLSNVVDYLSAEERAILFREVRRVLKLGAPILVYSNESYGKVPLEIGLLPDEETAARLRAADRAKIYRRIELYRAADPARARKHRLRLATS